MSTTAILCIARNEGPFVEEWLEYHFSIGIDRVYFVSTDSDFAPVKTFIDGSKFRSRIELLHFADFTPGWQMRCYNAHLPLIAEDWVLVIDIDEFLYLNTFPTIGDFLEKVGDDIGQIQFPWLILMSLNYSEARVVDILSQSEKYVSDHVKSMVRRSCCTGLGIHSHAIHGLKNCVSSGHQAPYKNNHSAFFSDVQYCEKHPFVLHFCSRGHLDVVNRILDHHFFNTKNGQAEHDRLASYLTGVPDWSNIPTRYLLMKFFSSLPTSNAPCSITGIQSRTNLRELETIFWRNIRRIVDFEGRDHEMTTTRFEKRYRLAEKLSNQDLSGVYSLDEYQKCSSQLEYVGRLRSALSVP